MFSVSFIKKPGLRLLTSNIEAAFARGALKELNRIRATGAQKALVTAAAGAQGIMQTRLKGRLKQESGTRRPRLFLWK